MKLSQVSTQSTYSTLRNSMRDLQRELIDVQKEVSTGQVVDAGLALGESNGRRVSMVQDIARLNSIVDTNSIAMARLEMTQSATSSISEIAQSLLPTLTASIGGNATSQITEEAGRSALSSMTAILNTTFNGEALFGGINSAETPIADYETGGPKAAVEAAFLGHFGFSKTDPQAAMIDGAAMTDFLENTMSNLFSGAGWATNFSSASDDVINARIGMNEWGEASLSANVDGLQNAVFASVIALEFSSSAFGGEARSAAAEKALGLVSTSASQIADMQGGLGFMSSRISTLTDRMSTQVDQLTLHSDEMVAVAPYEAATKLNSLITQIETSYTLTGRIQRLSLMDYV